MAVLSINGLAESMTKLVITPEDSDEDKDKMPFSVRSIYLSPSIRLRLFMEDDSFIPAFNSRFEVAISENKDNGDIEFIGSARSVARCLTALENLKEEEREFVVKKMEIDKEVHGRLTEKRNMKLIEIMDCHDVYILHCPFPLSFPTEITIASMDEEKLKKTIEEIEMMKGNEEEDLVVEILDIIEDEKEEDLVEDILDCVMEGMKKKESEEIGIDASHEDGEKIISSDESISSEESSTTSKEGSIFGTISSTVSSVVNQIFGGFISCIDDHDDDD